MAGQQGRAGGKRSAPPAPPADASLCGLLALPCRARQDDGAASVAKGPMEHTFTQHDPDWGYTQFMELEGEGKRGLVLQVGLKGGLQDEPGADFGCASCTWRRARSASCRQYLLAAYPSLPAVLRNSPGFIRNNAVQFRVRFLQQQEAAAAAAGAQG